MCGFGALYSSASTTGWVFKTFYKNIDTSQHTQELSRVLEQLCFTRPEDRTGGEFSTLIICCNMAMLTTRPTKRYSGMIFEGAVLCEYVTRPRQKGRGNRSSEINFRYRIAKKSILKKVELCQLNAAIRYDAEELRTLLWNASQKLQRYEYCAQLLWRKPTKYR